VGKQRKTTEEKEKKKERGLQSNKSSLPREDRCFLLALWGEREKKKRLDLTKTIRQRKMKYWVRVYTGKEKEGHLHGQMHQKRGAKMKKKRTAFAIP